MKDIEEILRLDIALMQRIQSRSKSRKPERPDGGKTTHAVLIDAKARSLLPNEIDISGVKKPSWYFFENKRSFNLMHKACPRNVQRLLIDNVSIPYNAAMLEFRMGRLRKA